MHVELTTEQLLLRPLPIDDLDAWLEINKGERHRRYLNGSTDPERARNSLKLEITELDRKGYGLLGIQLRAEPTASIVGFCGLIPARGREAEVEIVCSVKESHCRRGIATEASGVVLGWARQLGFARVLGRVAAGNDASEALVLRLGMEPIGTDFDDMLKHHETIFAVESGSKVR